MASKDVYANMNETTKFEKKQNKIQNTLFKPTRY